MAHPRRFRFGVQFHTATDGADLATRARRAEELGFSTAFFPDHFGDQLAPVPALMAIADATAQLRIGTLVLDNDYRHPVVLAKETATLDLLSDGRLELGLGAGHSEPEYRSAGLRFDRPGVRIERLGESLALLDGLLRGDEVTRTGAHYAVTGARVFPRPVQQPRPPFLVGGGGRRLLALAARTADVVGLTGTGPTRADGRNHVPSHWAPAAVDAQVAHVRTEAAAAGRPPPELHALVQVVTVTDDRRAVLEAISRHLRELSLEDLEGTPYLLVGSVDAIVEQLQAARERWGISYVTVRDEEAMAPVVARLAGT
jgi:probable F420-dependent oxidoreductase